MKNSLAKTINNHGFLLACLICLFLSIISGIWVPWTREYFSEKGDWKADRWSETSEWSVEEPWENLSLVTLCFKLWVDSQTWSPPWSLAKIRLPPEKPERMRRFKDHPLSSFWPSCCMTTHILRAAYATSSVNLESSNHQESMLMLKNHKL